MQSSRRYQQGKLDVEVSLQTRNELTHSTLTQYGSDQMMETIGQGVKGELERLQGLPSDSAVATSAPEAAAEALRRDPVTPILIQWLESRGHLQAVADLIQLRQSQPFPFGFGSVNEKD